MIIDAKDLIVGRFATHVAKAALLGQDINIVNAEKAVITGNSLHTMSLFKQRADRGTHVKGPFIPKRPHMLLKRMIRGMLPHRSSRGKVALARIKCHTGVPAEFEGKKFTTFKEANKSKLKVLKFVRIEDITQHIGGRRE
jgi:large subunit ribosomal protein L13